MKRELKCSSMYVVRITTDEEMTPSVGSEFSDVAEDLSVIGFDLIEMKVRFPDGITVEFRETGRKWEGLDNEFMVFADGTCAIRVEVEPGVFIDTERMDFDKLIGLPFN